jgi:hypothetical protein
MDMDKVMIRQMDRLRRMAEDGERVVGEPAVASEWETLTLPEELPGWKVLFSSLNERTGEWQVSFVSSDDLDVMMSMRPGGDIDYVTVHRADRYVGDGPAARRVGYGPPITAMTMKRIPFGALATVARRHPKFSFSRSGDGLMVEVRFEREATPRPGGRGHTDSYYAKLALAYEAWVKSGETFSVFAGSQNMSEPGLRTQLRVARDRGLLEEAPKGRKGGKATRKARELLRTAGTLDEERTDDGEH